MCITQRVSQRFEHGTVSQKADKSRGKRGAVEAKPRMEEGRDARMPSLVASSYTMGQTVYTGSIYLYIGGLYHPQMWTPRDELFKFYGELCGDEKSGGWVC